ncbi:MAG: hypothetical protein M3139_18965 [Bacteroidota bacterium]|nr:hypothetical protein [Bacteroidota bacterium]
MKKIFTLLFCTAILSSAFAQDDRHYRNDQNNFYRDHDEYREHHDRDHDWDHDRDRRGFGFNYFVYQNNRYQFAQRDELVQRVSYRYDYRVQQVINDWSLSPREKRYAIRDLRYQQAQEIANINAQCNNANSITIYGENYNGRFHRDDD